MTPAAGTERLTAERLHAEGLALRRAGDLERALEAIGRAVDLAPEAALLRTSFGVVLDGLGETEAALAAWRTALVLDPTEPLAWVNLANAAEAGSEREKALGFYRHALALDPLSPAALGNLGAFEQRRGRRQIALRRYAEAIALDPAEPRLWANLGSARHWAARLEAAGEAFDRALALAPDLPGTRFDRAVNRLLQGDYARGLADYEGRWQKPGARRLPAGLRAWTGEDPKDKHLIVWAEQGYGDSFQFARFIPLLEARGARVTLAVPRRLVRLLGSLAGVERVQSFEEPLPAADLEAPLMSLPFLLGLGEKAAAPAAAYLAPPYPLPPLPASIRSDGRPLVGLVWAGNPKNETDAWRSFALERLSPLLDLAGIGFVSLQAGPRAADVAAAGLASRIDSPGELVDFADTAAIVARLDLVVSPCTAMAHLAGSLGKEAWVMLSHVPDWRWGMSGETSSWYPSLRLFRQTSPGDWDGVARALARALAERFPGAG
jgi:Flp pilus assembly protein TadD